MWSRENASTGFVLSYFVTTGRGATQIDLLEAGIWEAGKPEIATSLQVAPILPPETHWIDLSGGLFFPTDKGSNSSFESQPNPWPGNMTWKWVQVAAFVSKTHLSPCPGVYSYNGRPRPGTTSQDSISATHKLNASFFESFHIYGLDWMPGMYLRWYIDDALVFEANSKALKVMRSE